MYQYQLLCTVLLHNLLFASMCPRCHLAAVAVLYSQPLFRTSEQGCLRAQIHKTGVKIQQLAILGCAHGLVFSMQNLQPKTGGLSLLTCTTAVVPTRSSRYLQL